MAYSYQQILESQYQTIADEQAQAAAELEAGRLQEDAYRTQTAADRILDLDQRRMALDVRARGFVERQQAPQQQSKYGLSEAETQVARNSYAVGDRNISNDERDRTYAEQKHKLARMRQTREYDDTQGKVFK